MRNNYITTGFTVTSATFDNTAVDNPYYETSSKKSSLIEEMKNSTIILETEI